MTRLDRWKPSRRLQAAALADRERVERELARLDEQHAALSSELEAVQRHRQELREELAVLNRFAHAPSAPNAKVPASENGLHGGPPITTPTDDRTALRGARIREVAVQVLAQSGRAYEPVHYRDWFEMLLQAGFVPTGKDPLATFLTQVGRSPAVTRTSEPGVYQLDHDFPDRAVRRLRDLNTRLRGLQDMSADGGLSVVVKQREERSALSAEVGDVERKLEEALRSFAGDPGENHTARAAAS